MDDRKGVRGLLFGALGLAAVFVVICVITIMPPIRWDPKFADERIVGRQLTDVIQELGKPSYDPRDHGWTNPVAEGGPLKVGYFRGWATYVLEIDPDGKVRSVKRSQK